jgi:ABC-type multidrug transport system permease subunit
MLFSFAFDWVFITIKLIAGTAQAARGTSVLMILLVFVSSAYVPVSSMPCWLQPVAEHQPVTPMVNAVCGLADRGPHRLPDHCRRHPSRPRTMINRCVLPVLWSPRLGR